MEAEVQGTLHAKVSSQAQVTADSLLTVPCDDIVHMKADIVMSAPAPKLTATILLGDATLEGRSFTDFRMPADGERMPKDPLVRQQVKL